MINTYSTIVLIVNFHNYIIHHVIYTSYMRSIIMNKVSVFAYLSAYSHLAHAMTTRRRSLRTKCIQIFQMSLMCLLKVVNF